MVRYQSKAVGRYILTIGILIAVSAVFLIIFFIGYYNQIEQLYIFGTSNDVLNLTVSILTCVMAIILLPSPRKQPILFFTFLILMLAAWIGAAIITVDSLRAGGLMSNHTFYVLRLKYGLDFITNHDLHFGDGLIGLWLMAVNMVAYAKNYWPRNIIILGIVSGALLSLGLFGLSTAFFGSLGQMTWNIWLGRWILGKSSPSEVTSLS